MAMSGATRSAISATFAFAAVPAHAQFEGTDQMAQFAPMIEQFAPMLEQFAPMMQKMQGKKMEGDARRAARADYIRHRLNGN